MTFDKKQYMVGYREEKKDMIHQYYEQNKERYEAYQAAYRQRTMVCECGLVVKRYNYRKHQLSRMHCQLVNSSQQVSEHISQQISKEISQQVSQKLPQQEVSQ